MPVSSPFRHAGKLHVGLLLISAIGALNLVFGDSVAMTALCGVDGIDLESLGRRLDALPRAGGLCPLPRRARGWCWR